MVQSSEPGAEVFFVEDDGTVGGRLVPSDLELIYEEVRIQDRDGTRISLTVRGEQTLEIWQRTAIPAFYLDASEPYLYHEEGSTTYLDDGAQKHVYRIRREPNHSPAVKLVSPQGPPQVAELVLDKHAEAGENDGLLLTARLSGYPDFQPPPLPPSGMFPPDEELRARQMRDAYLQNLYGIFSASLARLQTDVETAGGRILETFPDTGWISLEIPNSQLELLLNHTGIDKLRSLYGHTEDTECDTNANLNCTAPFAPHWLLGQGRRSDRLDADKFLTSGFDGSINNPARHGPGVFRLQAGIVESNFFENENLGLRDATGASRLEDIVSCSSDPCQYPFDYLDDYALTLWGTTTWNEVDAATHGTAVSSVLASDFRFHQADSANFGDPTYVANPNDLTHCTEWENASTGMAPGISLHYANSAPDTPDAYTRAYVVMRGKSVDVLNLSHKIDQGCDISSGENYENELENGYDSGITIVASSGNEEGGDSCNLVTPADTPKVLAVSSLGCQDNWCIDDYQLCAIDDEHAATGGMDAKIGFFTYSRVISGVDLVAPQMISSVTRVYDYSDPDAPGPWLQNNGQPRWPNGWNLSCWDNIGSGEWRSGGSSIAAPHVTGLTAVLKHWQLFKGNTQFNYPGRLQALVLAMADRWDPTLGRRTTGISRKSGFGRIKLRNLDNPNFLPAGFQPLNYSFTSSSSSRSTYIWPYPMQAGVNFAKCVMFEPEDMSHKDDISDIYLQMNLRMPDSLGQCSANSAVWGSAIDSSRDIRHMVAWQSNVPGKCVEVQVHKRLVTSVGAVVHLFCYFSSKYDFEDVED